MRLRRYALLLLALVLIAVIGMLYLGTRPAPVLTVMTWPGAYGRAQASAQMHPYAAKTCAPRFGTATWPKSPPWCETAPIRPM